MDEQPRRYQDSDFWLDIDNVVIGPEIGKGQFSTVYAGKYFGDLVAVKKQIRKQVTIEAYILRELSVLKVATHENLVQYIGASNNPSIDGSGLSASYIVTELCVGGDLLRLLQNHEVAVSWKIRTRIAMQIAGAIRFLHAKNIIHRDIKSSNILLDEEWNCKLSDFGLARFMESTGSHDGTPAASWSSADLASSYNSNAPEYSTSNGAKRKLTICGTSEYMPPEMLFDEDYSFPVDIFSFGMVIFETLTRVKIAESDFLVRKPKEKFMINLEEVTPFLEADYPTSMYTLATQCTDYDPSLRPDAEQTVDWIRDVYDQDGLDSAVPSPHTTRPKSIQIAMSALIYRDSEVLGVAGGQKMQQHGVGLVFSPQPVPMQPKMSFTSPSGVFKSLFHHSKHAPAESSTPAALSSVPEAASQAVPLTATEILLVEKYLLREPENNLFSAPSDSPDKYDEATAVVLKEGVLFKINETGFRNWKQIHCTLTESRLTWRSLTDPSKTYVFVLKDTTVRRTRDKRFMLSQKVTTTAAGKTPGKSKKGEKSEKTDVDEGGRVRAPTPDTARSNRSPSDAPAAPSSTTTASTTSTTTSTAGIAAGGIASGAPSSNSSVAGSLGAGPSALITQTALVQKELAAKSVEDMDDWIDAIQGAINEQKLGHTAEAEGMQCHASHHASLHSPADRSQAVAALEGSSSKGTEDFESVAQWLQSTGLPDVYCTQYLAILEERGYDSITLINNVGLKDSDFDYLGIDNPAHRRAMSSSIRAQYAPTLKLNINSYTKYDSTVLFKVTSRIGYQRSCIQIQLGHFKRLDRLVRHELHRGHANHSILQHLPALPSDLASRVRADAADHQRRVKLELYLMYLAEALTDTPHFTVLLKFLELMS